MSAPTVVKGQCHCTRVTWTSTTTPTHMDYCYCTICQQLSGAPFGAWTGIPRSSLSWHSTTTNPSSISIYKSSSIATRTFCNHCGATLAIQYYCTPYKTHVAAGTVVEGAEGLPRVKCHIFVAEKPAWHGIAEDGVERWDGFDDEFLGILGRWREEGGRTDTVQ